MIPNFLDKHICSFETGFKPNKVLFNTDNTVFSFDKNITSSSCKFGGIAVDDKLIISHHIKILLGKGLRKRLSVIARMSIQKCVNKILFLKY